MNEKQRQEQWQKEKVYQSSLKDKEQPWVFYEGPPTANGAPGVHHVLARTFKDVYARYHTMRGELVERKSGWDCHGLPVELEAEKALHLNDKNDVENFGLANFNHHCRQSVQEYVEQWQQMSEQLAFWDDGEPYWTMSEEYMQSVWWALAELDKKGYLYQNKKVVAHCPRCQTTLSSHELAQGYQQREDSALYLRWPLNGQEEGLLVWTTTPWTTPANVAVALDTQMTYCLVELEQGLTWMSEHCRQNLFPSKAAKDQCQGRDLLHLTYHLPFQVDGTREEKPLLSADFVTADAGSGFVHLAPDHGEDDNHLCQQYDLSGPDLVNEDGYYNHRAPLDLADRSVFAVEQQLKDYFQVHGMLVKTEVVNHRYPHCWRCQHPLLYLLKRSWYARTTAVKDKMLQLNAKVNWHPVHAGAARFADWLDNNVDWALSRERFWGTPLPVWTCPNEHYQVVADKEELERLSGRKVEDLHRENVDQLSWSCADCGQEMHRVKEVVDVWFDSGAMPFAQFGYPHKEGSAEKFQARFPADFVCEGLDQTRGWFYSLLALHTMLFAFTEAPSPDKRKEQSLLFDQAPYKNVLCLGLVLDEEGKKMSKSRGNAVDPFSVFADHGVDAFRWYFLSRTPWDGYKFSTGNQTFRKSLNKKKFQQKTAGDLQEETVLQQLKSVDDFYHLYADENSSASYQSNNYFDSWLLSLLKNTTETVNEAMTDYDAAAACRSLAEFVEQLSTWYLRSQRKRLRRGGGELAVLRYTLDSVAKLFAPFTPYSAEEVYSKTESVHLSSYPRGKELKHDQEKEEAMNLAQKVCSLGRQVRAQHTVPLRQPLASLTLLLTVEEEQMLRPLMETVAAELNVKQVLVHRQVDAMGQWVAEPDFKQLGPRLGSAVQEVKSKLSDSRAVEKLLDHGEVDLQLSNGTHKVTREEVKMQLTAGNNQALAQADGLMLSLDLKLNKELEDEGLFRQLMRCLQDARKSKGFTVQQHMELTVNGSKKLVSLLKNNEATLREELLVDKLYFADGSEQMQVNDYYLSYSMN